jgi:hypothetical protein
MAGLAERWEQSAIKAEELGLLEILVGDSNKTDIDFATVALLRRARVLADDGHYPETTQSMLQADGFHTAEKLMYGKVRRELKEVAGRARERQSSAASETAARVDHINRGLLTTILPSEKSPT